VKTRISIWFGLFIDRQPFFDLRVSKFSDFAEKHLLSCDYC